MSPDARFGATVLAQLRADIASDRQAIASHAGKVAALAADWSGTSRDEAKLALLALSLHAWYCGFEKILERVARALDESVPSGPESHVHLLKQAMVEVPGVRPALFGRELYSELKKLLDFRHFLRHAYAVALDPEKLRHAADCLLRLVPRLEASLDRFDAFLAQALDALAKS